jgi:hypothetical protein
MSQFMTEHSNNLLWFGLFNQGVINHDVLLPGKAKEVSIRVCASLASINHIQAAQWEFEVACQLLNTRLQLSWFQRGEFVEQGQDEGRVDGNGEELNGNAEEPEVVEEFRAGDLDDLQEGAEQGCSEDDHQGLRLEHVCDP